MDLREVLVLMDQRSPSLDTSMTGEETVAAFLSRKFTSRAFRNSSYFWRRCARILADKGIHGDLSVRELKAKM
jgi:hypothetical protein